MRKLSMDELGRMSVEAFKQAEKRNIVVVLDNIRSMHNVGSIFRTADAFLIQAICLCGYTPQPPHREINKTALGATESVDWLHYPSALAAVIDLKNRGYRIYAVEQAEGSILLNQIQIQTNEPTVVILGNEVEGVGAELLPYCEACIEIPQMGTKHSLNVSVAAGIVLWKLFEHTL